MATYRICETVNGGYTYFVHYVDSNNRKNALVKFAKFFKWSGYGVEKLDSGEIILNANGKRFVAEKTQFLLVCWKDKTKRADTNYSFCDIAELKSKAKKLEKDFETMCIREEISYGYAMVSSPMVEFSDSVWNIHENIKSISQRQAAKMLCP